jgi:hypothetical protein
MVVIVLAKRRAKIISYMTTEGWTTVGPSKTIREACTVLGLIGSAAEYNPWARSQLFILQNLVREELAKKFKAAKISERLHGLIDNKVRRLSTSMGHRMDSIVARTYAEYMYRNGIKMKISEAITKCIQIIVMSLTIKRWEYPIGHIVPRTLIWTTEGDSSDLALSVYIKQSKVWCMVPFEKDIFSQVRGLGKDKDVYINSLEYIALQLASIIVNELYEENPTAFPPSLTHLALGDNTPSLPWFDHHSTASAMGQNQIRLSAEYSLDANLKSSGKHLKGTLNTMADGILCPHERFTPHLTKIHDIPFSTLKKQVCQKHPILQSYRISS